MLRVSDAVVTTGGRANPSHYISTPPDCMTHMCIDFGSSGAKFRDCSNPSNVQSYGPLIKGAKVEERQKFYDGANAFERMKDDANFETNLAAFLTESGFLNDMKRGCRKIAIRTCGGTAGNRFQKLAQMDALGWKKFNDALKQKFVFTGDDCQTFPGTKEAQLEWLLTGQADMFVGIGGASMQLRLVTDEPCPDLRRDVHFQGGVGANDPTHYCHETGGSQLWSFLSDFDIPTSDAALLHLVGGGDQTLKKLTSMLVLPGGTGFHADWLKQDDTQFLSLILDGTVRKDPMWTAMLGVQHHEQNCRELPDQISLLSNARPKGSFASLLQTTGAVDKSDSYASQTSFLTFVAVLAQCEHDPVCAAGAAKQKCAAAIRHPHPTEHEWWSKFDKNGQNLGFDCVAWLYHLAWTTTLAGLMAAPTPEHVNNEVTDCFKKNMQRLLVTRTPVEGDWMAGAMQQYAGHQCQV